MSSSSKATSRAERIAKSLLPGKRRPIIEEPRRPELVPTGWWDGIGLPSSMRLGQLKEIADHIKWMMQKDIVGQDIFLIGPPGPLRRHLAFMFCEITRREYEYVALTRDTTEADLKQRREIINSTAVYYDQPAVLAALHGRVLILDGIEKAERNVLPVLNNLLENREISLEDGRFLMAAARYDELVKELGEKTLRARRIERVHPRFRVIALGLPVPRFPGNPLDPPLRSRFQARDVPGLSLPSQLTLLTELFTELPREVIIALAQFVEALRLLTSATKDVVATMPEFPSYKLLLISSMLQTVPGLPLKPLMDHAYPAHLVIDTDNQRELIKGVFERFSTLNTHVTSTRLHSVARVGDENRHIVTIATLHGQPGSELEEKMIQFQVQTTKANNYTPDLSVVLTPHHEEMIVSMLLDVSVGQDLCIIGSKGAGKSVMAKHLTHLLSYPIEVFPLFKDMTTRDLLQRRSTDETGDTIWEDSPLVIAAKRGRLLILDGIHHLQEGTIASALQRLITDRDVQLPDGSRLLHPLRYEALVKALGEKSLAKARITPIHPSFRVVALGEPPNIKNRWLSSEMMTIFNFHEIPVLPKDEESLLLRKIVPEVSDAVLSKVVELASALRTANKDAASGLNVNFSTRHLIRLCRYCSRFPNELHDKVHEMCLSRFLPNVAKEVFNKILQECGLFAPQIQETTCKIATLPLPDGFCKLNIGGVELTVSPPSEVSLVPKVLFYDIPRHLLLLRQMLKEYVLGNHLMLIGNQGVGKNKLTDRFLELIQKPRQYIQLHRDTTVQSLTLQPSVRDGVVVWDDSPLVIAVKNGYVLVVDEADKAPLEVVSILKGLVEDGEMLLTNGRRIVRKDSVPLYPEEQDSLIVLHPDFRMIVLANRPGYPFLGNALFRETGDVFSSLVVDNPDRSSELVLLKNYAPSVPEDILLPLVAAFDELRAKSDEGSLSYPFSTRELVNIVRHLEEFPEDGLIKVLQNVFAFDSYNIEITEEVINTFQRFGIPLGNAMQRSVSLAEEFSIPDPKQTGSIGFDFDYGTLRAKVETKPCRVRGGWWWKPAKPVPIASWTESRIDTFTEERAKWLVNRKGRALSSVSLLDKSFHVLMADPVTLYSYTRDPNDPMHMVYQTLELDQLPFLLQTHPAPVLMKDPSNISRVVLFSPGGGVILFLDYTKRNVTPIEIPPIGFNGSMSRFTRSVPISGTPLYALYQESSDRFAIFNCINHMAHIVFLAPDMKLHSIQNLGSRGLFVVTSKNVLLTYIPKEMVTEDKAYRLDEIVLFHPKSPPSPSLDLSETIFHEALDCSLVDIKKVDLSSLQPWSRIIKGTSYIYGQYVTGFDDHLHQSKAELRYFSFHRPQGKEAAVVHSIPIVRLGQLLNIFHNKSTGICQFEIVDFHTKRAKLITFNAGQSSIVSICELSGGEVATVQMDGLVRIWDFDSEKLLQDLSRWKTMIGDEVGDEQGGDIPMLDGGEQASEPKIGEMDGEIHVGGGRFAGGTGGRNTAGMGGKGGPFRLANSGPIHQISDREKQNITREVHEKAREMAKQALARRLKEIQMSEYDAATFDRFHNAVKKEVTQLRVILEGLEAKKQERTWVSHKESGDFDDRKLIEAITGEKTVYRQRGEGQSPNRFNVEKPKRMHFLVDLSASMYRYNMADGRLDRSMESILMILEAFDGFQHKFDVCIVGHSGDGPRLPLVEYGSFPKTPKDKLSVLLKMQAHTQHCDSGDSTLKGLELGVEEVVKTEGDDYYLFLISDANLSRYGIQPSQIAQLLVKDMNVKAYLILIASLSEEADKLKRELPAGRAHICLNTNKMPILFQQIFNTSLFQDAKL